MWRGLIRVLLLFLAAKLQKLSRQVLEDSGHVDRGTSTDTLCIATFAAEPAKTGDREGRASLRRLGLLGTSGLLAVDRGTNTDTLCIATFAAEPAKTGDREGQASLRRLGLLGTSGLLAARTLGSLAGHV